jgi:hypothetical protein
MHIHIITLPGGELAPNYLVARLAGLWRDQGHRVSIGPVKTLSADVGILHVDRTRVEARWVPDNPLGRPLLNATVRDISKRRISSLMLSPEAPWRGPVIIKTDDNSCGQPERAQWPWWSARRLRRHLTRLVPWSWVGELPRHEYPVLASLAQVPGWVWRRSDLVVERFVPEREGDCYALRSWVFFGDQEYGVHLLSRRPVVKAGNVVRHEYLDEVPESLREARRRWQVDFGKFDYVVAEGRAVLLDVNKTPTVRVASANPSANLLRLAGGLKPYLPSIA